MSYCDTCMHHEVCGVKGVDDDGLIYCADRIEPRDDAISRKAVFNLMRGLTRWYVISEDGKFNNVVLLYDDVMSGIDKLSSVIPQQKTGHWITKDYKEQGYDIGGVKTWYIQIMCSECGFIKSAIEGHTGQHHYCPRCGAKMAESQDNTNSNVVSNQAPILASPSLTDLKKLNRISFEKLLRIESEVEECE